MATKKKTDGKTKAKKKVFVTKMTRPNSPGSQKSTLLPNFDKGEENRPHDNPAHHVFSPFGRKRVTCLSCGRTGLNPFAMNGGTGVGVVGIRMLTGGALSGSTEKHPIATPPPSPSARPSAMKLT
jgi:hypothetical protein